MMMNLGLVNLLALMLALAPAPDGAQEPKRATPYLGPSARTGTFLGFRPQMRPMSFDLAKQLNLKPLRSGGYLYRGSEKERFDARIFPDGSVEFRDAGAFEIKADVMCFGVVCPKASPKRRVFETSKSKKDIETHRRRTKARKVATRVALGILTGAIPLAGLDSSSTTGPMAGVNAGLGRPGSMAARGVFYTSGRFGRLPSLSIHKQDFLARTRTFRLELAVQAQEVYMRRVLRELSRELSAIEKNTMQPAQERRERLLRLWEQFDVRYEETPLREAILDRVSQSMGKKVSFARKQILAFARRVFPKGEQLEFSQAELERVNQGVEPDRMFIPYPR